MLARFGTGLRRIRGATGGVPGLSSAMFLSTRPAPWKPMAKDLLKRTKDFDAKIHRFGVGVGIGGVVNGQMQAENYALLNDWRHLLFQIPQDETKFLSQSASSIDKILRISLDQLSRKDKDTRNESENKNDFQPSPTLRDDIATGIYAWGRAAREDSNAPLRAEALVEQFEKIDDGDDDDDDKFDDKSEDETSLFRHNCDIYSALVYCWSQAPANEIASEKSLFWFRKMVDRQPVAVTPEAWNALLRIHVKQGKFSWIEKNLLEQHSSLNNGYSYVSLVEGWMDSNDPNGIRKAYQALQRGIAYCIDKQDQISALQQLLYRYLMKSIEKNHAVDYERVMNQALVLQEDNPGLEILDAKHFIVVMNAMIATGDSDKVVELFRRMQMAYERGSERLKPDDYQVLVAVLSAMSKTKNSQSLQDCEGLLSMIESYVMTSQSSASEISNHAYNIVIDCFVRFPHVEDRSKRVELLIRRMEKLSTKHNNPQLLPDKVSYSALMKAIMQENKPGCLSEVEDILQRMESSDVPSMQPDRNVYTVVLEAILKNGGDTALFQARRLMDRMERTANLQPDRVMYTILMKFHSVTGDLHLADEVLKTMIEAYRNGRTDCCPNEKAFVTAISAWERSEKEGVPDEAFRLFNDMVSLYDSGIEECRPSRKIFGMLMVILAKRDHESKLPMAQNLISQMETHGVTPDLTILNWYMRVCTTIAASKDPIHQRESWTEALLAFNILHEKGLANSHSYNSIFHACHKFVLDPQERYSFFRDTYYKCRSDGQVDRKILTSLRRFLSPKVYRHLTKLDPKDNGIKMKVYRELNNLDAGDSGATR